MLNILIAEDDNNIRRLMEIRLKQNGFNPISACDGEEALKLFEENKIDFLIVDVMMPKKGGIELIKDIRDGGSQIPAIIVSAKGSLVDKTKGFLVGIDDYMVKPVEFDELLLRIRALLRRAKIVSEQKIIVGNVTLDNNTLSISDNEKSISLTKREFSILFKLLSYPEKAFTKGELFEEFWGINSQSDEDVIKVFVNKIRTKIKDFPQIDISTIRGVGYKGVKNEE